MHYQRWQQHGDTRPPCSIPDCTNRAWARSWCNAHYMAWRNHGDPTWMTPVGESRFWSKVSKGDGCWEWTGYRLKNGYGQFRPGPGQRTKAHRYSYELAYGPISDGMFICHHCDNPPCVRPDHLFVGTPADNSHDRDIKGRGIRGRKLSPRLVCAKGHPLDEQNTYVDPRGRRTCRTCRHDRYRLRRKGSP